jgi:hypothetical protein
MMITASKESISTKEENNFGILLLQKYSENDAGYRGETKSGKYINYRMPGPPDLQPTED